NSYDVQASLIMTWPLTSGAPAIPGIEKLGRADYWIRDLVATDSAIYALGGNISKSAGNLRMLADGTPSEVPLPASHVLAIAGKTLYFDSDRTSVYRFEDGKAAKLPLKLPPDVTLIGADVASNGDLWMLTSKHVVIVAAKGSDALTETPLPAPANPPKKAEEQHYPATGSMLAGVAVDDPYAIGAGGALFHLEKGQWTEVPLPDPPFATVGKYQAQSLTVPVKGDPYINAGYFEKGVGWKTPLRYHALLRAKRPKEVLRCNE